MCARTSRLVGVRHPLIHICHRSVLTSAFILCRLVRYMLYAPQGEGRCCGPEPEGAYCMCISLHMWNNGIWQVYGTSNIRVVDLSILPLITAVHTQGTYSCFSSLTRIMTPSNRAATTYGIAEQGKRATLSAMCIMHSANNINLQRRASSKRSTAC